MMEHSSLAARFADGSQAEVRQFADSIHLEGAKALATFTSGIFAGQPVATSHCFGKGRAIHFGGRFPLPVLRAWFGGLLEEIGVVRTVSFELPGGVYATRRKSADGDVVFLMNFGERDLVIDPGHRVLESVVDGARIEQVFSLPRFGLRILRERE